MTPLSLSDAEMEVVTRMAEPIAFNMRREYLQAVAEALAQYPQAEIGVGTVHQVARAFNAPSRSRRVARPQPAPARRDIRDRLAARPARPAERHRASPGRGA